MLERKGVFRSGTTVLQFSGNAILKWAKINNVE